MQIANSQIPKPTAIDRAEPGVDLAFSGVFGDGPLAGGLFAGTIRYCPAAAPTAPHAGFAEFEWLLAPVLTLVAGGRTLSANRACVYAAAPHRGGRCLDMVTFDGEDAAGSLELFLAAHGGGSLRPDELPDAATLEALPVRRLTVYLDGAASGGDFEFVTPS